jgi:anti-sigma factor RsiW
MNCAYDKEKLTLLLTGELEGNERLAVRQHLDTCPECRKEYEALQQIWHRMGEIPVEAPSGNMQAGFHALLHTYGREMHTDKSFWQRLAGEGQKLWHLQPRLPLAFSLILLLTGLGLGYELTRAGQTATATDNQVRQLTAQVQEMKQAVMVSLLGNPSASERMRAVSYTDGISQVNRQVAEALLTTLNNDPNVNVRLVTLEALVKFARDPLVREGLIQSIAQQDSPLMQSAIADVMVKLQEKRSVQSFQELLNKKDINEMVRKKIEHSIHQLI